MKEGLYILCRKRTEPIFIIFNFSHFVFVSYGLCLRWFSRLDSRKRRLIYKIFILTC
jgi:hypothetical protein